MRKSEVLIIGDGHEIVVQELTVKQVSELLDGTKPRPMHPAEVLLNISETDIPMEVVCMASGLTPDELDGVIFPSELHEIWLAVARVNSFLSQLLARAISEELSRKALEEKTIATTTPPLSNGALAT